jgi:hypothetical protein
VVAVGDDERVVALDVARAQPDLPGAIRQALGVLDPGGEADAVAEAEVVDVGVEVRRDLAWCG